MSTPTTAPALITTPSVPPQPSLPTYNFDPLAELPSYTRGGYLAATGVQYANWNQSAPGLVGYVKLWADTSGADPSTYMAPDLMAAGGSSAEKPLTIIDATTGQPRALTLAEAASFNFPGLITYPAYAPAASDVTQPGTGAVLNANYLSNFADAVKMAIAWGLPTTFGTPGATIIDAEPSGVATWSYPTTETRRQYAVIYNGQPLNVGIAMAQENAEGVGHPGHWDFSQGSPNWIPDVDPPDGITTGVAATGNTIPAPVRPLNLSTEYFEAAPFQQIINTTLVQPPSAGGGVATVGDYTAVDRATALDIQAKVGKIMAALGIS
jgi:hypothetical protein